MFDLVKERNKKGISQKALAEKIGVSQHTIAVLELGERKITGMNASAVIRLADYFGVKNLRDLLDD